MGKENTSTMPKDLSTFCKSSLAFGQSYWCGGIGWQKCGGGHSMSSSLSPILKLLPMLLPSLDHWGMVWAFFFLVLSEWIPPPSHSSCAPMLCRMSKNPLPNKKRGGWCYKDRCTQHKLWAFPPCCRCFLCEVWCLFLILCSLERTTKQLFPPPPAVSLLAIALNVWESKENRKGRTFGVLFLLVCFVFTEMP